MERTAPLLEAVRRDARGVTAARRRVWTRRALIAGFVCALMYVHYRTMHALAAFSTESFAEVPENRAGGEADASAARIGATREASYHVEDVRNAYDVRDDGNDVGRDDERRDETKHANNATPDSPGTQDHPPGVPVAPPAPTKRAPDRLLGGCADAAGAACAAWVASGECDANPAFMLESCRKSCGACGEKRAPRSATGTRSEALGDEALGFLGSESSGFARLDSGALMPLVGFGTAGLGEATERAVLWALEAGYRSIDSAQAREWYREDLVGNAVARSGVAREALFLTSKLHPRHLGYDATTRQFQASLDDLRVDYLDLFLLHYPRCWGSLCDSEPEGTWQDSWRALEALHAAGKARAIGVSNFDAGELRELARVATVQPAVVQRNSDVFAADLGVRVFCTARGWQYEAYSSLGTQWLMKGHGTNPVLTAPAVVAVAERRGVSPAAVALRWALDKGQVVIPRSSNRERIEENLRVLDMPQLTESEMDELDKLDGHPPFVTF